MDSVTFLVGGAEVKPMITISTFATILDLKQKIEDYTGVHVARQTLWSRASKLDDSTVIGHYGFEDNTSVHLVVQPPARNVKLKISVSAVSLGFELEFEVKETDTVSKLKQKIAKSWAVAPQDMALWHLAVEMKDDQPLSKYYIHEGCKINLRTPMLC